VDDLPPTSVDEHHLRHHHVEGLLKDMMKKNINKKILLKTKAVQIEQSTKRGNLTRTSI
jgi:hypothetical protein